MNEITTIGLDLAKYVFPLHGIDASGEVALRRQLRRRQLLAFFKTLPPCLVGVEACATSHYWARELQALGHAVRIMPANYVKAYVKRNKTDAADAQAICEAVTRPTMRFVGVKSAEQQSLMMLHRSRSLLVPQRTMLVNAIRAHMAELSIVAPVGRRGVAAFHAIIADPADEHVPALARHCLESLVATLITVEREVAASERRIHAWHRSSEASRRLETIPGIGPII
ncbi:MAG: IS110 family transposase, partial [Caldilineaceae bacterium]|nr:IS110 family transposase [Caldilineaceae bacterium]